MATPTTYTLTYDTPCDVESKCGEAPCGGKPNFNPRPQIFCDDVSVLPAAITVGGITFVPRFIAAQNGTFLCLAR
jgi:hypothetical protein